MKLPRKNAAKGVTMEAFLEGSGPGDSLAVLRGRQDVDVAWAERAFRGEEPLARHRGV